MNTTDSFAVILPAAGTGNRFGTTGGTGDKLLVDLNGRSVLQRSVAAFAKRADVHVIAIVTAPDRFDVYRAHLAAVVDPGRLLFVAGGRERWESVLFALRALAGEDNPSRWSEFVAVHDAARPLVGDILIEQAFGAAREHGAALPCLAEPATLKRRTDNGCVRETVDRRGLYQAQTPQCFEIGKLLAGYEKLRFADQLHDLTDDAQVYERMGWAVRMTEGSPLNAKITTASDVAFARAVLAGAEAGVGA